MPHLLPALAAAAAGPLLGLAMHAAVPLPAPRAAATLPNNLCASCHGGGKLASVRDAGALDARDLVAARTYLQDTSRG